MNPGTLVTVFNKHPGVVKANGKINPPANHVRVEFRGRERDARLCVCGTN